jgi:uncharacterized repeat protein (TIGR03803 family)
MRGTILSIQLTTVLAIFAATLFLTGIAASQERNYQFVYLHSFNGKTGMNPQAGLILDAAGNLYGTTGDGGANGVGTAFELSRTATGGWQETVLHSFGAFKFDATYPYSDLVFDAAGNLYSTSCGGGVYGYGTAFELSPTTGDAWKMTVLHSFNNTDGNCPWAPLIFDAAGNLYGTTRYGATNNDGVAFELTPTAGGSWSETELYQFTGSNGANPVGALIFDAAGNLYGTTQTGGSIGAGTAFELTPSGGGAWTEKILYNFGSGSDGSYVFTGGLIFDPAGNLYGTTYLGGTCGAGTVFELTPIAGGNWSEAVLHDFGCSDDGVYTQTGVIRDAVGNLYGTADLGGAYGAGMVFELTPSASGSWTEKVLINFDTTDGYAPEGSLVFDPAGNIYSTAGTGGHSGDDGTIFELKLVP